MNRTVIAVVILAAALLLGGCAAGPNTLGDSPDDEGRVAGFGRGLWHGVIAPITFVISLFTDRVELYEVHNNGGWYNFGFLLGAGVSLAGPSHAHRRRRD